MPEQPLSHIPFRKGLSPFSQHSPFPTEGENTLDKHPPDTLPPVRTVPAKPHERPSNHRVHLRGIGTHPPTTGRHGTRIPQGTADVRAAACAAAASTLPHRGRFKTAPCGEVILVLPRPPRPAGQKAGAHFPGRASVIAAPYYQGRVLPAKSKIFQYSHRAGKRARCNGKVRRPGTRFAQVPDGRQLPGSPCGEHQGQFHPSTGGGTMPDP